MRSRGKQVSLGGALDSLSKRFGRNGGDGYLQSRLAAEWDDVAGPSVAQHTTGAHLRSGEFVVFVDSPVWATELSALAGPYRDELNRRVGKNAVRSMRFAVSKRVESRRKQEAVEQRTRDFYAEDAHEPVPLTPEEAEQVASSVRSIPDPKLRDAVYRATVAGMQWRKGLEAAEGREKPREGL